MMWHICDNDLFSPLINLCQPVVHHALLAHQVHLHHPAAAQAHHPHQAVQAGQTVMSPYTFSTLCPKLEKGLFLISYFSVLPPLPVPTTP